jgi:hypothetical protein
VKLTTRRYIRKQLTSSTAVDVDALKKENEDLKTKNAELTKKVEELTKKVLVILKEILTIFSLRNQE